MSPSSRASARRHDPRRARLAARRHRLLAHRCRAAARHPGDARERRPGGCPGHEVQRRTGIDQRAVLDFLLGATWDPDLVEEVGHLLGARDGGQGRLDPARPDGQPAPHAHRWSQLRVHQRGPVPDGAHRGRLHRRSAGRGRRQLHQALRGQRHRVRAHVDRLRDRRAHAARAVPGAVRGRGARRRRDGRDDRLQPDQRAVVLPTARCWPTCCAASGASTVW